MQIGERIRKQRTASGMTQKQLADQLHVTAQAVSRWENGEVEPGIDTLVSLSQIFQVSIEELIRGETERENTDDGQNAENEAERPEPAAPVLALCAHCNRPLFQPEEICRRDVEKKVRSGRTHHTTHQEIILCPECNKKEEERLAAEEKARNERQHNEAVRCLHRAYGWASFAGIATPIVAYVLFWSALSGWSFLLPLLAGYGVFALVFCIIQETYISDVFAGVFSISFVKLPGLIFSFDADGCAWYIGMKILFWLIGIALSILGVALALAICVPLSAVTYPFVAKKLNI